MPRSLWTGSLSFGLVNVPVGLYSAARDLDVHFHQLHEKDGARIEVRRFCSKEDSEVAYEEIGHGYELDSGKQVVLTDARPRSGRAAPDAHDRDRLLCRRRRARSHPLRPPLLARADR
jgi:non-homologous end joining protein Ku